MSRRPSVFVLALTVGDYLLWNWSLNGNHDAIALVSGLTLPPLALVSFWILALGAMRLLAILARLPRRDSSGAPSRRAAESPRRANAHAADTAAGAPEESPRIAA